MTADEPRPPTRRMRFVLVGLPLIAVFAAFGSIMWLAYVDATPGSASGEPPLIRSDTSPAKIQPEDPGGRAVADQGEVRGLIGDEDLAAQTERLLPPPEEPVTPADAPDSSPPDDAQANADEQATADTQATADGQADGAETEAEASAALDALLAEVTEPTDGATGASGDQPTETGSETSASASPEEATTPAASSESAGDGAGSEAAAPAPPEPSAAAPDRQELAARDAQQTPGTDGAGADAQPAPAAESPSPPEAPNLEVVSAPEGDQVAAADGTYRIQLAAVRNESDARRAWDLFRADLGEVIGGLDPVIERANTANGTFYRVQVGPFTDLAAAESLCEDLKQRNASCFVIRR